MSGLQWGMDMPRFGKSSRRRLETCSPSLIGLFEEVVKTFDCSILDGHRSEERQNAYFNAVPQKSKVKWPDGKHNKNPSLAVDVAPWPIKWDDTSRFYYFAGYVKGIARMMEIPIRWGGDWDNDTQVNDQRFKDLVHFELPSIGK